MQKWLRSGVLLAIAVCGCGKESIPTSTSQIDVKPATSTVTAHESNTSYASENPHAAAKNAETVAHTAGLEGATIAATNPPPNLSATATVAKLAPIQKAVPAVQIKPSDAQLVQWKRTPYEPLELLAFRQSAPVGFVACMAHTPDGKHFVLAGSKVTLWSLIGIEPEHVFLDLTVGGKEQTIKSLAISPDGKWVAAGDSEGMLYIWDLSDRKEKISKKLATTGITQIAISLDSLELATTSYSSEVTVWSAEKLEQKNQWKVEAGLKRILYMSPNGLVAAAEKTTLWNVAEASLVTTLSPGRYNASLARSNDGKWFAFGDKEGLKIWDVSRSVVATTFPGQAGTSARIEFSPDDKLLATVTGSQISIMDIARNDLVQVIDSTGWATVGVSWLPVTNRLLIAKEDGTVRFWGPKGVDAEPMHNAIATLDIYSKVPTSPAQLLQAIDLRSFPKLPNAVPLTSGETSLSYESATPIEEAMLFYRYSLDGLGWAELPANPLTPSSLNFQKDGFKLHVSLSETGKGTNINLVNLGNYDLRWAPRFDAAPIEVTYESESTVLYKTKADLLQIETSLLRKMHDAGWTAYSRLNSSHNEEADARRMEFVQNGLVLNVSIGKFPGDPDRYNLSYSANTTIHSIPIPADCGFVEFSSATEPLLVANTSWNLVQTREFYDREMLIQGWLPRAVGRIAKEEYEWLPYFRGQQDITIGLSKHADDNGTLVRVGTGFENSSWQLSKTKEPSKTDKPAIGIEAADFPILNPSKVAKIDLEAKSIDVHMDATSLSDVDKQYTDAMSNIGWKVKNGGIRDVDYLFITFAKEGPEIALRARTTGSNATANFQGDGLLWNKPIAGGDKRISYESWLRRNLRPSGLQWLDDYEAEMGK